ncbi:hypothetical protein CEQ23_40340 [Burkholderia cepacia]|uniref:Uncharacterized protein n=1 Tax=Burkholderia cepacia TaxID=292 RepID=A0ABN5D1P4_BURCE|nr:hypothetical protein CO711_26610 [Burkholderia cepacia]AVL26688.1 hypothetical protein CEQ23_40340 [Burkholderia cepacia]
MCAAGFRAPVLPCSRAPVLPCSRAPVLPCFRASVLPCFRASVLPGFRASGLPGFRASGLPGFVTGSAPARAAASGAACLLTRQRPAPQRGRPGADGRPRIPVTHTAAPASPINSRDTRDTAPASMPRRAAETRPHTPAPPRHRTFPYPKPQLLYKT